MKKKIIDVLDSVSRQLGNTRTVCKKYYVHPVLISLYESKQLLSYFKGKSNGIKGLSNEENVLVKIIRKNL